MFNKLCGYLAAIAGAFMAIFAIYRSGKSSGKDEVHADQNEEIIKSIQKDKQREKDTAAMSDSERVAELLKSENDS